MTEQEAREFLRFEARCDEAARRETVRREYEKGFVKGMRKRFAMDPSWHFVKRSKRFVVRNPTKTCVEKSC